MFLAYVGYITFALDFLWTLLASFLLFQFRGDIKPVATSMLMAGLLLKSMTSFFAIILLASSTTYDEVNRFEMLVQEVMWYTPGISALLLLAGGIWLARWQCHARSS